MTRRRHRPTRQVLDGSTPRPGDERPPPNQPVVARPRVTVDRDALREAQARLAAEAELYEQERQVRTRSGRPTALPVTGVCHDCGQQVSGERRYCGPCVRKH